MLNVGEDILKCDMAETYHIYVTDWYDPPFPLSYLADLANGLSDDSRIKIKLSGRRLSTDRMLKAIMVDKLAALVWQNTKDGCEGRNVPESILSVILNKGKQSAGFETADDFDAWRRSVLNGE